MSGLLLITEGNDILVLSQGVIAKMCHHQVDLWDFCCRSGGGDWKAVLQIRVVDVAYCVMASVDTHLLICLLTGLTGQWDP